MCEVSYEVGILISIVKDYWIGSFLKEKIVFKYAD